MKKMVKDIEILQLYKKVGANPNNRNISTRLNTGTLSNKLATAFNSDTSRIYVGNKK